MGDHGGARKGAGRKPRLLIWQRAWLKRRYAEVMAERAKERALRRDMPPERIAGDLAELREYQDELRRLPISQRKTEDAGVLQSITADMIRRRVIRPGSGRGPLLKFGEPEATAEEVRNLVAIEGNALWGRSDITARIVRRCCAMRLADDDIVAGWLNERDRDNLEKGQK